MNDLSQFRKCTLTDEQLLKAVDTETDKMFEINIVPKKHIPARPDNDLDLLIGELILRFKEKINLLNQVEPSSSGIALIDKERQEQIVKHGRTIDRDVSENTDGQLMDAVHKLTSDEPESMVQPYNWNPQIWDKMIAKPITERLIIAGALIAAEIDRLNAIKNINQHE